MGRKKIVPFDGDPEVRDDHVARARLSKEVLDRISAFDKLRPWLRECRRRVDEAKRSINKPPMPHGPEGDTEETEPAELRSAVDGMIEYLHGRDAGEKTTVSNVETFARLHAMAIFGRESERLGRPLDAFALFQALDDLRNAIARVESLLSEDCKRSSTVALAEVYASKGYTRQEVADMLGTTIDALDKARARGR